MLHFVFRTNCLDFQLEECQLCFLLQNKQANEKVRNKGKARLTNANSKLTNLFTSLMMNHLQTKNNPKKNLNVNKWKYVYCSCLLVLLQRCLICSAPAFVKKVVTNGSALCCYLSCENDHQCVWRSQPLVKRYYIGNLRLSASAFFSSNTYRNWITSFQNQSLKREAVLVSIIGLKNTHGCITTARKTVFGFYCMKHKTKLTAEKNEDPAYISVGFKNWKKAPDCFKDHQNSLHIKTIKMNFLV